VNEYIADGAWRFHVIKVRTAVKEEENFIESGKVRSACLMRGKKKAEGKEGPISIVWE